MASTSSSQRPSSSSSSSKWRHDVFLSFRGEDNRKSFTDHLYWALDRSNIKTFRDDEELPRGEEIAPELLKAIEGSRIAIIVFSKTYAHSKWCLDELVKIMECQEEKGQKVFPIFYHVEPSEVRNQTGIYGEAFKNHERNADEEKKKKKIEEWRTVLRKAGNLSGFPLQDRSESRFIEGIIGEIRRLIPKLVHVGENIVGMDEKLKEVKLLIDVQPNAVSMVGIYGIGGIGKTTTAKVLYNDMLHQFKRHSFLKNVREKSKDDCGLLQLQEKLLYDILMEKNLKLNNVYEGIEMIKSKCCLEKVLIVLDDVDCPKQLKFLAPNSEWFHRGSIIIVTTRNKRCLDIHKAYSSYEAKGLAHDQAMELFSWNAFQQRHPKDNYVDLSNRILCYAKGLPLALVVLGSFLYQRDVDEWESTLHKLKTTPPKDIQKVLQISYDGLDDNCKKLFLDIACFFKDHDEKFVTRILEGCGLHPKIELRVLDERCLISILGGTIRMHDLLQEMGWTIVRQNDPKHPEKWSRLWEYKDIKSVFTKNMGTENIEGIFLNMMAEPMQVTAEAFRKMNGLRLLNVGYNMVQLSEDFELPCHDLTYFRWHWYPLESMPSNFHAHNLVQLNLQFSNIKHLWKGNMCAKKLEVINLSYSKHLVDISMISSVPNLEILILEGCISLESLPRNLHKLQCLQTLSCEGCSKIKIFPEIKGNMGRLRELNLSETNIMELPSSIRHLQGLEVLDLSYCENLVSLSNSICSLSSLQTLLLVGCSDLKGFPDINSGSLKALELLDLSRCKNLESLPDSICSLISLQTLLLVGCSELKGFPDITIGSLKALQSLNLSGCKNLESLPDSICSLSSLQTLLLVRCSKLKGFPDINIGSLKALELLDLSSCKTIESLPVSICNLSSLKTLRVRDCPKIEGILEVNLGVDLCSLRSLNLTCRIVKSGVIWSNECFSSIKTLNPRCRLMDEEILNHICPLSSLVELCVTNSNLIEKEILRECFHLSSLQISSLSNFHLMEGAILSDIFHQSSLVELSLSNFNLMEGGIPSDIWNLSSLISLSLSNCNLMEGEILDHICYLSSLEKLSLNGNHFSSIPSGISRLSNLRALNLSHCKNLLQIPELPSSLRFLDAHCSNDVSSSPLYLPIHSLDNCFKSELIQECWISVGGSFFQGRGMSIVIPRSSGILEWIRYQSMGSDEVTIELPPNWLEDNDLLGFALCCVYVALDDKFDYQHEDPSSLESRNESDYESVRVYPNEKLLQFYCTLSIQGNNRSAAVEFFSFHSWCDCNHDVNYCVSDGVWLICWPKVAIEERYHFNQWTHIMASFNGPKNVRVEECGIHLIYAEEYEEYCPTIVQGSSSRGNFGEPGLATEDTL